MVGGLSGRARLAHYRHRAGIAVWAWADYLRLAKYLVQRVDDEAAARAAISRAYYAAFDSARMHLVQRVVSVPSTRPAHALVWSSFHATADPTQRRIANIGRILRKKRSHADYDEIVLHAHLEAQRAIDLAERLLADLAALP